MSDYTSNFSLISKELLLKTSKSILFTFMHPSNKKKYVAKLISNEDISNNEQEFNILSKFNHPNIIKAKEYRKEGIQDYLITEFMEYGDLLSFLTNFKFKLLQKKFIRNRIIFEKFWRTIFIQIVDAILYMKSLGWAHLDIKPENILLNSNFEVKLIDFEYSLYCKENDVLVGEKSCGTWNYFSPEIKERLTPYNPFQSDVFSLGITFNNLVGVCDLFPTPKHCIAREENYLLMKENKFEKIWIKMDEKSLSKYFTKDFRKLIESMIKYDANKRVTIEDIRDDEWFKQEIFTKEQIKMFFLNL